MSKEKIEYEIGSGNVYKDLGFPNPEEMQAKAHLVFKILDTITERNLTLDKAAEILRIQDLRSFHNLMKNYDENGVIFSIFSVPARLQSTKSRNQRYECLLAFPAYRWVRKSCYVSIDDLLLKHKTTGFFRIEILFYATINCRKNHLVP